MLISLSARVLIEHAMIHSLGQFHARARNVRRYYEAVRFWGQLFMLLCVYSNSPAHETCRAAAYYLLELGSRQGQHCKAGLCKEHVRKAWSFGQRLLEKRFPKLHPTLCSIRLMPISNKARATGAHHCAEHSSDIAEPASTWPRTLQPLHHASV